LHHHEAELTWLQATSPPPPPPSAPPIDHHHQLGDDDTMRPPTYEECMYMDTDNSITQPQITSAPDDGDDTVDGMSTYRPLYPIYATLGAHR
jgi:hypothetical protein